MANPASTQPAAAAPAFTSTLPFGSPSLAPANAAVNRPVVSTPASAPAVVAPDLTARSGAIAAVSNRLDQKMAAIAARGPEYEAIAKLSREIIEEIVWEVVPELAEIIIREQVDRLAAAKK
jgi:hypothetical protein